MKGLRQDATSRPLAVLYRILGNDLPPRHATGQTLESLRFILSHEPCRHGLERGWILNRIVCKETEHAVVDLLKRAGEDFVCVPFHLDAYARMAPDFSHFEQEDYAAFWKGEVPEGYKRILTHDHAVHSQNRYVMNINGARNLAIKEGRSRARWVMPWDGNCFLTDEAWEAIRAAMEVDEPGCRYLVVPMERILDNAQMLDQTTVFPALEEPQIAFRDDALEQFDERLRYGRFSKVELLRRLGVPGVWDSWEFQPWEGREWTVASDRGAWRQVAWVARLASGQPAFDRDPSAAGIRLRSFARRSSIRACLGRLDTRLVEGALACEPSFVDLEAIQAERQEWQQCPQSGSPVLNRLIREADTALSQPSRTVLQKTRCAPNGDWQTYHSVAPFWWPNPDGLHLPYVRRDGVRTPEADLASARSTEYDSTRLQHVIDDVFVLSWACYVTGKESYAHKAAAAIEAWFCDPLTAMRPNLDFAQIRRGTPRNAGQPSGVIDARDIYLALEAVRLLERLGMLSTASRDRFTSWAEHYLSWLLGSDLGQLECQATNNHGTCFEIQVLSLGLFLRDTKVVTDAVSRARSRLFQQFSSCGTQPEESTRRAPLHYACFNLQSWMILAKLASCAGLPLTVSGSAAECRLRGAVEVLIADVDHWRMETAAVEQGPRMSADRLVDRVQPVVRGAAHLGFAHFHLAHNPDSAGYLWPHPYSGVPPLWQLAFSPHSAASTDSAPTAMGLERAVS